MIIKIELPDFKEDNLRLFRVMSGIEERARIHPDGTVEVKTVQCDGCGKCCMNVVDAWEFGKDKETGWCSHLKEKEGYKQSDGQWAVMCDLNSARPFSCCGGDDAGKDYCCVEWEKVS